LLAWYGENARDLPWRRTRDPYGVWVSEIMLQQTQVKTVLPYWERWMRELPTIDALAKAPPGKIHKLWEGLGYYHRVRNLQRAAQIIRREHRGRLPSNIEELLDLPGIGRYTAGAICSIAFNQAQPILDGNVIRVLTRVFGIGDDPRESGTQAVLWQLSGELVQQAVRRYQAGEEKVPGTSAGPTRAASTFNQALMEIGALVCLPRDPHCEACPLAKDCVALRDGRIAELPHKTPRPPITPRRFIAFVLQQKDRFLVRQRPAGEVNAHLWEFPNLEVKHGDDDVKKAAQCALGCQPANLTALGSIKHSITRYRITMDVFHGSKPLGRGTPAQGGRWLKRSALARLPFASAHKKILERLPAD